MRKRIWIFLWAWLAPVLIAVAGPTLDEDVETLIDLLRIEEDTRNQYDECIRGSDEIVETELDYELENDLAGLKLDADDVSLLISIYSEFYRAGCAYLGGGDIPDFYRGEFRRRFSAAEIRTLIDFYRTPVGVKLTAQWLDINGEYGRILQRRQAMDSFEAQRRYEERIELFWEQLELKARQESIEQGA